MTRERDPAREVVDGLVGGAGEAEGVAELVRAALENADEPPAAEYADVFVVLTVDDEPFVRSTALALQPTWREFWDLVSEWSWVELKWWCDDQGLDEEALAEIAGSITPDLYAIDLSRGRLLPVGDGTYADAVSSVDAAGRQFAFLAAETADGSVERALRRRVVEIHEIELPPRLERVERVERVERSDP